MPAGRAFRPRESLIRQGRAGTAAAAGPDRRASCPCNDNATTRPVKRSRIVVLLRRPAVDPDAEPVPPGVQLFATIAGYLGSGMFVVGGIWWGIAGNGSPGEVLFVVAVVELALMGWIGKVEQTRRRSRQRRAGP
jgi:hypothetical protein